MSAFHVLIFAVIALIIWSNLYRTLLKSGDSKKGPWWNQPVPPVVRRIADVESGGLAPAIRLARARAAANRNRISSSSSSSSSTEVHMNPISAVIFIIFIGGAVGAGGAELSPLAIVLALIGIFLGYSVKMAQQWEKAVILRLGKLHAVKGPGLFILVPIIDQVT